jgi:hypothetical protein
MLNMQIKLKVIILFSFVLIAPAVNAINFIQVSENENMKVFLDIDSIEWSGSVVSTNEIRDYKVPMEMGKIGEYRSSLNLTEIDCKKNISTIRFIDTFELNGLKGKLISHGVKQPLIYKIRSKTMTSDVRDFLCSKRSVVKT